MFTKDQISKMKEEEFQNTVLIPLFRKMGFQDVKRFDGGNLERGKDIVMWKPSDLGQRLNYGVVVKAIKITGNAKTAEGAMNVLNQVRQMLKNTYLNPVNGSQERIQRCYVVCSKEVTAEAMNSIEGELDNNFDKLVEWIEPETNLFGLVEQYLPEQDVFEKLSDVQKNLDEQMKDTPYKIVGDSEKKFHILGKHEKAHEEMPFIINGNFQFDTKTNDGKVALEKLKNHFETGSPVEIDGKHIESIKFPDFIPDWMKPKTTEKAKLILQPNRSDFIISWRIERILNTGDIICLDRIDLQIIQHGTKEITLKNDNQNVPWQFTFVINFDKHSFEFDYVYKFFGYNVLQHLQGAKFLDAMSKAGKTNIYQTDINLKIINSAQENVAKKSEENDWSFEIRLLEALVFIQEKISVIIDMIQPITNEQVNKIFEVAEIIRNGKLCFSLVNFKIILPLNKAKEVIESWKNESEKFLYIRQEQITQILGNEINLGVSSISFNGVIKTSNFNKIKNQIENSESEIEFCFTPTEKSIVMDFLKFECEDRHTRYEFVDSQNL
jgi:hypothetical protein